MQDSEKKPKVFVCGLVVLGLVEFIANSSQIIDVARSICTDYSVSFCQPQDSPLPHPSEDKEIAEDSKPVSQPTISSSPSPQNPVQSPDPIFKPVLPSDKPYPVFKSPRTKEPSPIQFRRSLSSEKHDL
jgi:hypothetical protein